MMFDNWKEEYGLQFEPNYSEHTEKDCRSAFEAGQQSQQAKIDELQARVDISEKLRDSQFEKLWSLTQAIEKARNGADEDFDLFLNYLSNILTGNKDDQV